MSKHNYMLLFSFVVLFLVTQYTLADVKSTSVKCSDGQCENGFCVNETCVCKDGWTGSYCQFCDGRFSLTASEGELHDGVGDYPTNTKCSWLIDTNSTLPIKLTFHHFSTECGWDHLHVFDGSSIYAPLVGSFSGISHSIKDITLHSGYGFLYFYSDVAYSMGGFNLTYRLVSCPADCNSHGTCLQDNATCVCEKGWTGSACDIQENCYNDCSNKGVCENGTCKCQSPWLGIDCSVPTDNITWLSIHTQSSPLGRASLGADVLGDFLYTYGGETLLNRFINHSNDSIAFYRYNILTQTWSSLSVNSSVNSNLYGHSLSANPSDQKLYLYGGTTDDSPTAALASYHTVSSTWEALPPGPVAVTGHTAHIINNKLYVFFGQSAIYSFIHYIQVYDIDKSSWSIERTSGVLVPGRYGHSSVYDPHSRSVFIFGGYHSSHKPGSYKLSHSLYKYMVDASIWVGLSPAHRPSFLHSMTLLPQGYLLVSGGNSHNDTVGSSGSQCYSSTLLVYNMCCDEWIDIDISESTDTKVKRFGHVMYQHNDSIYIYGGFNGVMLSDTIKLHIPECSQFITMEACETGGSFSSNTSLNFNLCEWNSQTGCKAADLTASCSPLSCQKTEAEERKRCNQFTDCQSCTVSDRCYYKAQSSEYCGLVPPTHSVHPDFQDPDNCPNYTCSVYKNCDLCSNHSDCIWSKANNRCLLKQKYSYVISLEDRVCPAACHTHDSCKSCADNNCLWCESQSQCIDSNSYLSNYVYGQCLEWTTSVSHCESVACSEIKDCSSCQRNAMCGWCNNQSNTGEGTCMRGGLEADLESSCQSNDTWHFTSCPACQCNGHSQCDDNNQCIFCEHNTTGNKCETCKPGYFGDPSNSGTCQRCECDAVADACDDKTGACFCRVQGSTGDSCQECDINKQYLKDTINNQQCYYLLGVDFKYTFNFSKAEDKHVSVINLQAIPKRSDVDVRLTLYCKSLAYINLTVYSGSSNYENILDGVSCYAEEREFKISHKQYNLDDAENATMLLTLTEFSTPFVFQVSFIQQGKLNLYKFFLIFFGCFLALLILAGVVWKARARYAITERRNQERQERQAMAKRPFASILLLAEDLSRCCEESSSMQVNHKPHTTRQFSSTSEPMAVLQRTFSKRIKNRQGYSSRALAPSIGLEPLATCRGAAVSSIIFRLPTGEANIPNYGCSGLAIGSTLVSIPVANTSNHTVSKVSYKQGKVTFKYP